MSRFIATACTTLAGLILLAATAVPAHAVPFTVNWQALCDNCQGESITGAVNQDNPFKLINDGYFLGIGGTIVFDIDPASPQFDLTTFRSFYFQYSPILEPFIITAEQISHSDDSGPAALHANFVDDGSGPCCYFVLDVSSAVAAQTVEYSDQALEFLDTREDFNSFPSAALPGRFTIELDTFGVRGGFPVFSINNGDEPYAAIIGFGPGAVTFSTSQPVPGPASLALLGIGVLGLFAERGRRRKAQTRGCSTPGPRTNGPQTPVHPLGA